MLIDLSIESLKDLKKYGQKLKRIKEQDKEIKNLEKRLNKEN